MIVEVEQEVLWSVDLQRPECNNLRLPDVLDGQMLALCDDILHFLQASSVESRLHTIHYIIYSTFAENRDEQSSEEARQPASLPWLWDVALAAMLPLPNLLGNKEAVEEVEHLVLQPLEPLLLGYLVEGEDIDIDALMHLDMLESGFREARAIHANLHKVEGRVRLCVRSLQEVFVAKLFLGNLGKTLIVGTHHAHIDIVVPGQHLPPEVSANGSTARHEVTDLVLFADAIHLFKRLIERILKPA